jgi:hypothetical protein
MMITSRTTLMVMFQSVYDYPYLSSSANHSSILTIGYDESSGFLAQLLLSKRKRKSICITRCLRYFLVTLVLQTRVRLFESDLKLDGQGSMKEVFFVNFSRLLTKDQIKKGSVSITLGTGPMADVELGTITYTDANATENCRNFNTVGGDYGITRQVCIT